MGDLLPLAWFVLIAMVAARRRPPRQSRLPPRNLHPGGQGPMEPAREEPAAPTTHTGRRSRRRHVLVALVMVAAAAVWLPLALVPPAAAVALPVVGRRRAEAAARAALLAEIPDVVDLLRVAVAGGLNVRLAIGAVARRAAGRPLAQALGQAEREARAGARLADALARIPDRLGEAARPVVFALVDAERYGTAVAASLDRLGDEARTARRHHAEERARRIPIKLLFPLVTCILPAFGLLTVAPLIAGGLRALRLT